MKSIVIIIPYFGKWPEWFELFLVSCKWNESIDWLFYTDCPEPEYSLPNVRYIHTSFTDYCALVSSKLGIDFKPTNAYKLCDVKPFYGFIHEQDIAAYDYFGFGDVDVIYGNLRHFLTDHVLTHNLISTHANRISGHFCLLKNIDSMRNAFRRMDTWESFLENSEHQGIDESKFTKVFLKHRKHPEMLVKLSGLFDPYQSNNYWKEQYSTILSPKPWHDGKLDHPEAWQWRSGRLVNDCDGDREFMYLHFMNWKSSRWLSRDRLRGNGEAAWEELDKVVYVEPATAENGFNIDRVGFSSPVDFV